ncbi:MAG TPA: histidine kinase dimerization/phosphoacceptor domain -containing protein [Caulobacteraceae bacterium]|nr:histidine kinase dimerization/phosphoacceptor domain -containing protein [Caulobacteraceae bacterium]
MESVLTRPDSPRSFDEADGGAWRRALFETMSEGFALVEPIWNGDGRLADYRILEINPALQGMLGVGPDVVGRTLGEGPAPPEWLAVCERAMKSGRPVSFEYGNPDTGRWHEIRLTRIAEDRLAQFFFDVTERKEALNHQAQLFDELNHRVKNSLAMVSSLLQVQSNRAPEPVREHLAKAVARVDAIAEVHGALYGGGGRDRVDFAQYLRTLCERLAASLVDDQRIRIEVTAESAEIGVDHAAALGMIVNELVTNAVKHAYPAPDPGVIDVTFQRRGRRLSLTVSDRGPGPPAAGIPDDSEGLGVRLVKSLVRQLRASFSISGPPGTRIEVRLPADAEP